MSTGVEILTAYQYLKAHLAGAPAVAALVGNRIFSDGVPPCDTDAEFAAQFPCIVFSFQGGTDARGNGSAPIYSDLTILVKGIAQTRSLDAVAPINAALHAALDQQAGATPTGAVLFSYRLEPFYLPETPKGGKPYRHMGGTYRLQVQSFQGA